MLSNLIDKHECRSYGLLWTVTPGGVSCFNGDAELYNTYWTIATSCDAIYMDSNIISTRQWLSYGYLGYGIAHGGLSVLSDPGMGTLVWHFATNCHHTLSIWNLMVLHLENGSLMVPCCLVLIMVVCCFCMTLPSWIICAGTLPPIDKTY